MCCHTHQLFQPHAFIHWGGGPSQHNPPQLRLGKAKQGGHQACFWMPCHALCCGCCWLRGLLALRCQQTWRCPLPLAAPAALNPIPPHVVVGVPCAVACDPLAVRNWGTCTPPTLPTARAAQALGLLQRGWHLGKCVGGRCKHSGAEVSDDGFSLIFLEKCGNLPHVQTLQPLMHEWMGVHLKNLH